MGERWHRLIEKPGILIISFFLAAVFRLLDACTWGLPPWKVAVLVAMHAVNLANIGLFSAFAGGGLAFSIFLLWLMSGEATAARTSLRRTQAVPAPPRTPLRRTRMRQTVYNLGGRVRRALRGWVGGYRLMRLPPDAPCRIVIGASGSSPAGWFPTEVEFLNLCAARTGSGSSTRGGSDAILAEHVWEHLTEEDRAASAAMCYAYLKPGGYVRAAVPDGLNPRPDYREWVRPGGTGPGADKHKVL